MCTFSSHVTTIKAADVGTMPLLRKIRAISVGRILSSSDIFFSFAIFLLPFRHSQSKKKKRGVWALSLRLIGAILAQFAPLMLGVIITRVFYSLSAVIFLIQPKGNSLPMSRGETGNAPASRTPRRPCIGHPSIDHNRYALAFSTLFSRYKVEEQHK